MWKPISFYTVQYDCHLTTWGVIVSYTMVVIASICSVIYLELSWYSLLVSVSPLSCVMCSSFGPLAFSVSVLQVNGIYLVQSVRVNLTQCAYKHLVSTKFLEKKAQIVAYGETIWNSIMKEYALYINGLLSPCYYLGNLPMFKI